MKETIRVGVIGLGHRGFGLMDWVLLSLEGVKVVAVCDLYEERAQAAYDRVVEKTGEKPLKTLDYKEILAMPDVDAVVVPSSWEAHIEIAVDAMKSGKAVACEVGGAYSIDDCWRLVRTYEETKTPCMLLENCCYGRDELMVLNMVKKGVLGDIIHCEGGYHHDLRSEVAYGRENKHGRLRNYLNRNCENYPTHELGPIAKVLDINRGNRLVTLTSMASRSAGIQEFLRREKGEEYDLTNASFAQGDVVTTIIKCAHGETITITLDTSLPRAYSRGFTVQGTKGMFAEDTRSVFLDQQHNQYDADWKPMWNNVEQFREEYDHPIWKKTLKEGLHGGHGGMDGLVLAAFFAALRENRPMPIDVYDMAAWMAITPLSEQSIAMGGMPMAIPDFTNGKWTLRGPEDAWHFGLSEIYEG